MSLSVVLGPPCVLNTGAVTTLVCVRLAGLSSEGSGWGEAIQAELTTEAVTSRGAGVWVVYVHRLIRDHGGPGYLHQVLIIIVLEAASELMEGHVTRPGHVSRFLT